MESQDMITKEELKDYAKLTSLNLGQAEKDYFQNIILFILYRNYGNELVFKGGTALKKCYGLNRFSEDLDFTCTNRIDTDKLETGLKRFNIEFEKEKEEYENSMNTILRIKGPLYMGIRPSLCKLIIDFIYREKIQLKPEIKTIGRFLEEIPSFDVFVMHENEIFAEKIRAIMTRTKARDVYDLWFLLEKGIKLDEELVKEKLKYCDKNWNSTEFSKKLNMTSKIWLSELRPLIDIVPDFNEVKKSIHDKLITKDTD